MREKFLATTVTIALLPAVVNYGQVRATPRPPAPPAIAPQTHLEANLSAETAPATAKSQAELLAARNQSIRQTLPLIEALLGQWSSNDGRTQYYFTANQVTVVNWLTNGQAANTHELRLDRSIIQVMNYQVVNVDETNAIVRIRFETPLNWVEERLLRFTANRQTLTEWLDIMGHRISDQWVYVGQRQEP